MISKHHSWEAEVEVILSVIVSFIVNHGLRGSLVTDLVNGKGQFSTAYRIDTPQPITKIFVTGD